jgi:hypothetical protein
MSYGTISYLQLTQTNAARQVSWASVRAAKVSKTFPQLEITVTGLWGGSDF